MHWGLATFRRSPDPNYRNPRIVTYAAIPHSVRHLLDGAQNSVSSFKGNHMAQGTDRGSNGDYSCEVLSLIVLFFLSALSHFWYIFIAIGVGIFLWIGIILLGRVLASAAQAFPWHGKYLWLVAASRRNRKHHSSEWRQGVSTPLVNELSAPSSLCSSPPECVHAASPCKESGLRTQVF